MAEQAQHAAHVSGSRPRPAARRQAARPEPVNEVRLLGRVSAEPEVREMPSGDELVTWRLVVDRGPTRRAVPAGTRVPTVDTLDCVAWSAAVRRTARGLAAGDVVEVSGALRKRFWRTGAGASSRTEVEVARVRRVARA
jgi:single-strand DNA-binding protein